jgi:hypothetical protein
VADKRKIKRHSQQGWYHPGLQWWSLAIAILLCWTFIAVLQYYLHRSQTRGGIIFAPSINDLPLHRSFWYLYLPTIIAVAFSVFVIWIDHDAKRYEPYRQMSQSAGALAQDSIFLHYPFDFSLFVPILAAKRKYGALNKIHLIVFTDPLQALACFRRFVCEFFDRIRRCTVASGYLLDEINCPTFSAGLQHIQ